MGTLIEVVHIVARVTTDMTRFNAGMASMEARAKTATAKMSLAGMRMTKYLTLPIAGIAYASVKAATSFQKSMTQIQTQAGAAAADLPKISRALKAMAGKDTTQGPTELANAYYHLQSVMGNTVSVASKLRALKDISHLATIGGSDMESTTSAVAGILRTHLRGAKDTLSIVKTINGIVGSGNMRMPQFVESTGTAVLQVAKLLGMSLKQVGAAEAVFTDENMNANMSMTRLRTSLMMAIHPSQAAQKEMQKLGVSSLSIGSKMRGPNGFGNVLDYLGERYDAFVKKLIANGASQKDALTQANAALFGSFGGSKGASVWATLINQRSVFHSKLGQITQKEKMWNQDLSKSMGTMSAQFEKAWARIQVALIDFGNAVAPIVLGMAKGLAHLANAFSNLPTPVQHFIAAVGVGLAVLGPMLIVISSLIKSFQTIGMLFGAEGAVGLGFGTLLPLAIIAAVGALVYFAMKSKTFRDWLKSWGKEVMGFFKWLGEDVFAPFFKKIYHYFADGGKASRWSTVVIPAMKAVGHTVQVLGKAFVYVVQSISKAFQDMIGWAQKAWHYYSKFAGALEGAGGFVAGLVGAGGGGHTSLPPGKASLLAAMDAAHGHHQMALYQKLRAEYRKKYPHKAYGGPVMGGGGYLVGENGPEVFYPGQNGRIGGGGTSPLVHIAEMHVRHESDAEIVSGKIARRIAIP